MYSKFFRHLLLTLIVASLYLPTNFSFAQRNGPGPGPQGTVATALTTFETDDFSGSGICAFCHSGLTDEVDNDVSNDAHWRSTMMANAAKDPLWQAKISSEVNRNQHLQSVIEEKCSRCHMGMARYQAIANGTDVAVLGTGFLDPAHYLNEAAMDGISCTLCHQVQPDNLGTEQSFTGKYVIDTSTFTPNRLIFGPYEQPLQNPMRNNSGFSPTPGVQIKDSTLCGSCHTLYTPTVDAGGNVIGEFPEQTTYLEWEHSGFTQSCQDCHVPDAVGSVVISNRPRRLAARSPFGQHHFVGGNSFMVSLLKNNATELGVTADAPHFEDTIARTQVQLQQDTATLTATASTDDQNLLTVKVVVQNLAGHKVPSGLPSRRTWLHLVVKDANGAPLFESGKVLADGRIEGNNADMDISAYEPHYDLIDSSDQVQIYEPVMIDSDGQVTYTLLRADSYAKDNRLLPAGFSKDSAIADIAVRGNAQSDPNFVGGEDEVTYQVDLAGEAGPFEIVAELLFQTLSYPFINDLSQDETALISRFMGQYSQADKMPVLLAIDQTSAP